MSSEIHNLLQTLPAPPKNKNTITPNEIINAGIYTKEELFNAIEEMIVNGVTMRNICDKYKISLVSLSSWLALPEHFARTKMAYKIAADYWADKSVQVLIDCPLDKVSVMLADKQSKAYRWRARVGNVEKYGEKLDVTSDGKAVVQVNLGSGIKPPELSEETTYIDVSGE